MRWLTACTVAALVVLSGAAAASESIDQLLAEQDRAYAAQLKELSAWCEANKLAAEALQVGTWQVARDPPRFVVFFPPNARTPAATASPGTEASPPPAAQFAARFAKLRRDRAAAIHALATQAAAARDKRSACELLWETLREDPDHADARRMLGFERVSDAWAEPFAARQLRAGRVWHDRFGWLAAADVPRYEKGERRAGDRWTTAEQDARRHADIRSPWRIETEHYVVSTNHSLEEGVRLASELERLHRAWRQVFVEYWLGDTEFNRMFALGKPNAAAIAPPAATAATKHRVVYYRDRDEYVRALGSAEPRVAMSLGLYLDAGRAAHFFAGPEQHPATVYHEATHQLFKESRAGTAKHPGAANGIWLVEAAACYMESFTPRDGYATLGERDAGRFPAAREKIEDNFYVPLAELAGMSAEDLVRRQDIAKVYSQASGLMTFLLHADAGRYRPGLAAALDAIYTGKATPASLAQACGKTYEQLDHEYQTFIKASR